MCNETEKHRRWRRYRYFIASLSFSTTTAPENRLSLLPLGNQCSQFPTCPCELVPGLRPQIHMGPSLGEHWGGFGGEMVAWEWAAGQMCTAAGRGDGWHRVGHCPTSCPCSWRIWTLPCANPPVAAFLNWGGGRAGCGQSAGHSCHTLISVCKKWGGRHTHTEGILLVCQHRRKGKSRRV